MLLYTNRFNVNVINSRQTSFVYHTQTIYDVVAKIKCNIGAGKNKIKNQIIAIQLKLPNGINNHPIGE